MADISALVERLPAGMVETDPSSLTAAATDRWALALLRGPRALPAAVAYPGATEDVATILRWASESGTAVVPRGLGSGVCGAAEASEGCVVLDLSRMSRVLSVDAQSAVVEVEAGIAGSQLEEELAGHGLTTGHYPQSIALSSVGGWIATASAGQASAGYGAIEHLVLGLTAVLADGTVVRLRPTPRSAAGPDLRRLFVGSEGTLGVVTEATLACAPTPRAWSWRAYSAPGFTEAIALARAAEGAFVVRAYDEADAALAFGAVGHEGGSVLLLGYADDVPPQPLDVPPLHERYGEHWWEHRNDAVPLYDAIMGPERAWGAGVVVDTLETAGLWRDLPALYEHVGAALGAHAEAVACHLSHPYRAGASLYFTFLIRAQDDAAAEHAYSAAWDDALTACLDAGGTLTHHHGVGLLKARFLPRELGDEGVELLRRIKRALDPHQILNPGKLLP